MAKNRMFMPNPDGSDSYLVNLAGAVLSADAIFGDPNETTPQGRTNAMRLVERTLHEAEKKGFLQSSTVWALMRRNDFNPRLKNLVQEAVGMIPNDVQGQIMQDVLNTARTDNRRPSRYGHEAPKPTRTRDQSSFHAPWARRH